ncbi:PREDICTED: kininogen-1-like, partial [Thamnophis sirtalis]|uniref:Kininogen-1-like n=1 Tax=Thamnophis sirtalis TaxID=35019 RepID=A0A6I9YVN0_9SAUR
QWDSFQQILEWRKWDCKKESHCYSNEHLVTTGPQKKLHIVYGVRETVCPVAAKRPWQKCELLRTSNAHSGNCVADIDISGSQQFTSISQICQFSQGQKMVAQSLALCPGCWRHINTHSNEVIRIVMHTIRQFNNQSQQPSLFGCPVIKDAQSQVVNGVNYRLAYSIKE